MISFDERCYSNQYDETSDDDFFDDEITGFADTVEAAYMGRLGNGYFCL